MERYPGSKREVRHAPSHQKSSVKTALITSTLRQMTRTKSPDTVAREGDIILRLWPLPNLYNCFIIKTILIETIEL